MLVDREEFDAPRWYEILENERVTVWYTAPTAIRMLMKAGVELARTRQYPALRHLASVGEPLNRAVVWGVEAFGKPFHDNWWPDRDRRDHGRELSRAWKCGRIDGTAGARCGRRDRAAPRRRRRRCR